MAPLKRANIDGWVLVVVGARHPDADDLAVADLELAGVKPNPHFDSDLAERIANGGSGLHGSGGPIEYGKKPVPRGVELSAVVARQLAADDCMVRLGDGVRRGLGALSS